jgi:hypothetical protein
MTERKVESMMRSNCALPKRGSVLHNVFLWIECLEDLLLF